MMKPASPLPEKTPWSRLDSAFQSVIKVRKEDLLKEEARLKRTKARRKRVNT